MTNPQVALVSKSTRHQAIVGRFGEYVVCNWLSRSGFEVTLVDHTGIDVVAFWSRARAHHHFQREEPRPSKGVSSMQGLQLRSVDWRIRRNRTGRRSLPTKSETFRRRVSRRKGKSSGCLVYERSEPCALCAGFRCAPHPFSVCAGSLVPATTACLPSSYPACRRNICSVHA